MASTDLLVLEGLVTSQNADGTTNVSPMGPLVDVALEWVTLRPFQTSTTFKNLQRTGQGIFHVTDDVDLLARAAIGQLADLPALMPATAVEGQILSDACRWYALRVRSIDASQPRATILADVVDRGRLRDFLGFNRAKHAVVEAAILATRVRLLPAAHLRDEFRRLKILVDKTGGKQEREAFALLARYVESSLADAPSDAARAPVS